MKVFYSKPETEVRIVRPNDKDSYYEFYVLKPVYVGSARRIGSQRVAGDNGREYTNLNGALRDCLESHGEQELAATVSKGAKPTSRRVKGVDLMLQNKWVPFCEMRGLDARAVALLDKEYEINPRELSTLGLTDG